MNTKKSGVEISMGIIILIIMPISYYIGQLLLGIIAIANIFWIMMLTDCLQRTENKFPHSAKNEKLIWVITLIFLNFAGALLYFSLVLMNNSRQKSPVSNSISEL